MGNSYVKIASTLTIDVQSDTAEYRIGLSSYSNLNSLENKEPQWQIKRVQQLPAKKQSQKSEQPQQPHIMGCLVYNVNADGSECVLRGEMLNIVRLMLKRLDVKSLSEHMVAPVSLPIFSHKTMSKSSHANQAHVLRKVLLFSYMGPQHGRILHAYFDGKRLNVRYTKMFDLRHQDVEVVKLFAQWMLSEPTGDTTKWGEV